MALSPFTQRIWDDNILAQVDPIEKIMSVFSEDAVYEENMHGEYGDMLEMPLRSLFVSHLLYISIIIYVYLCKDLTREDEAFVGLEAIKKPGSWSSTRYFAEVSAGDQRQHAKQYEARDLS